MSEKSTLTRHHIHTTTPTAFTVLSLAWPMAIRAILLHGAIVIDGYLVSSLGELPLAALGIAAAIAGFPLGAIFAFSNAMQIRTAQSSGTGNLVFHKSTLASGLFISLIVGITGVTVIAIFGWPLLQSLASTEEIAELAWSYLSVFSLVILGEAIAQCLASYFNGCGRSKLPLYGFCLSQPVNILFSVILIHGFWGFPTLGVAGAAWGSVIGMAAQLLFLLFMLFRMDRYLLRVAGWHQRKFYSSVRQHWIFSLPIATTFISASFSSHTVMIIYAKLSIYEFAAFTLVMPWVLVAGTIGMQWAQATGIIIAQLLGQKTQPEILDRFLSQAWRGAFAAASIIAIIYSCICLLAPIIYSNLSAETHAVLLSFLPVLFFLPFPKGSNAICGNTLRVSGDTVYVMHIFVWSQWLFRVPATALAVLFFNLPPIWVLSVLLWDEVLKFPVFHRRLYLGNWKKANFLVP